MNKANKQNSSIHCELPFLPSSQQCLCFLIWLPSLSTVFQIILHTPASPYSNHDQTKKLLQSTPVSPWNVSTTAWGLISENMEKLYKPQTHRYVPKCELGFENNLDYSLSALQGPLPKLWDGPSPPTYFILQKSETHTHRLKSLVRDRTHPMTNLVFWKISSKKNCCLYFFLLPKDKESPNLCHPPPDPSLLPKHIAENNIVNETVYSGTGNWSRG